GEGRVGDLAGGSKPERLEQFLGGQVLVRRKDLTPGLEQARVVRRGAADPLAERHDLPIQVFEFTARSTLEALEGRGAVGAVRWEVACQPAPEQPVTERHGKRRHETKGAGPAALIEAEATKL